MEDLNREERVKLPEGWNSYNKTWITKDGFKDQKGKEITDIDDKIKKFIELLNNVDVSKFEGGITNFCFRFPYIVKDIFGTECKLQKGGWFGKDKSTNPFDYKGFCDAIFNHWISSKLKRQVYDQIGRSRVKKMGSSEIT